MVKKLKNQLQKNHCIASSKFAEANYVDLIRQLFNIKSEDIQCFKTVD